VVSSNGMNPVIEGSHGPSEPSCFTRRAAGATTGGGGGGLFALGGGTAGPGVRAVRVVVVADPAVDAKDCLREAQGSWPGPRACFGIGGCGWGITGHLPLVRTERCA
jgi:hypothetical protein